MTGIDILTFVIYALAIYMLSLLVSREDGPARIFKKLRAAPPAKSSLRDGLSCQLCQSIWFSVPITSFWLARPHMAEWAAITGDWLILMLALSACSIIFHMHTTKDL